MRRRHLTGLLLGSALVTLDGTAATVALPAVGRDLGMPVSRLLWVTNAPLLMLAALLLPAGAAADRFSHARVLRIGLLASAAGALASAVAPSDLWMIGTRSVQGAGGALVLPPALALLRSAYVDPRERTRKFGLWAAVTGLASAAGPLIGGGLVDLLSWRAVFAGIAITAFVALTLLRQYRPVTTATESQSVPLLPAFGLIVLLGAVAYLLIEGSAGSWGGGRFAFGAVLTVAAAGALVRSPRRHVILPRELVTSRNCLPANAATFALYFGMFGLSFLLVLYTQQVLGYSATRAATVLLPVSVMLLLAEPFGRMASRLGTRMLIMSGVLISAAGVYWIGVGAHPLAFWTRMMLGTALFGLGLSLAVSALTHAAVSAVPETLAGAASGLNHATARAAGLGSIALLGSLAARGQSQIITADGFRLAMMICAAAVAAGGIAGAAFLRDEAPGGLTKAAGADELASSQT